MLRLLLLLTLGVLAGCGSNADQCLSDLSCGTGRRCVFEFADSPGVCEDCAPTEVPYNGIDDDCNPRTNDADADADGDLRIENGGTDCDDQDPEVRGNASAREVCDDGKDNNCDGRVDELECGDVAPPEFQFLSPVDDTVVSGTVDVDVRATDDAGITRIEIRAEGILIAERNYAEPFSGIVSDTFSINTANLSDGPVQLVGTALDVRGAAAFVDSVTLRIDNRTPPTIVVTSPEEGASVFGAFVLDASAEDLSGVMQMSATLDGATVATSQGGTLTATVPTARMDSAQTLVVSATDTSGNTRQQAINLRTDRTPPTVRFISPVEGAEVLNPFTVTVQASDPAGVTLFYQNQIFPPFGEPLRTSVEWTFSVTRPEGEQTLEVTALDGTEVIGEPFLTSTATLTVQVSNPRPEVRFLRPLTDDLVSGVQELEVFVNSPNGREIEDVRFSVGNTVVLPIEGPEGRVGRFDFSLLTGRVELTATVTDDNGVTATGTVGINVLAIPDLRLPGQASTDGMIRDFDIGDVNQDGLLDVVMVSDTELRIMTSTLSSANIWRLSEPQTATNQAAGQTVRVADVDNDGWPDAVVFTGTELVLALNPGMMGGTWVNVLATTPPIQGLPLLALADLDDDDDVDVVLGGDGGRVLVYLYDPNMGYQLLPVSILGGGQVTRVETIDANRDGFPDLAVGRGVPNGTGVLSIYENRINQPERFAVAVDTITAFAPQYIGVGNLAGDVLPDVVVANGAAQSFQRIITPDDAPFGQRVAETALPLPGEASGAAIADLAAGGRDEVFVSVVGINGGQVWGEPRGFGFELDSGYVVGRAFVGGRLRDLDGDGRIDIIGYSPSDENIAYAFNRGTTFEAPRFIEIPNSAGPVTVADVASPAGDDLVIASEPYRDTSVSPAVEVPAQVRLFIPNAGGPEGFARSILSLPDVFGIPSGLAAADFTPNGRPDLAVTSAESDEFYDMGLIDNLSNLDFRTPRQVTFLGDARPVYAAAGNVDGSGVADIVVALDDPEGTDLDGFALIRTTVQTASITVQTIGNDPVAVVVADVRAGQPGFIIANRGSQNVSVCRWNVATQQPDCNIYNGTWAMSDVAIAPFGSMDPDPDIVAVDPDQDEIFILKGDPIFVFQLPTVRSLPMGTQAFRVQALDYNDDGVQDIITFNNTGRASLLLGTPSDTEFFDIPLTTIGGQPLYATTGDLNNDGETDIVVTHSNGATVIYAGRR